MSDVNGLDRDAASAASVRRTAHVRSQVAGAYRKITPAALPATAALLVGGLCLRLFHLSTQSLWTDEGYSLDYSACAGLEACVRAITSAAASEKFDILYFLMLHVWRDVFGSSTIALRSLSVILSVLTLPVIWLAAERLFGRRHAVWSLALAATSAFSIFYAQETRPYAFLIFLTAVQVWLFSGLYADHAGGARKLAFLVVTFVASWASIYCVLFSMALAAAHLVLLRRRRRTIVWWLPLGAACVPAVVYYCVQTLSTPPELITLQKSNVLFLNLGFVLYGHLVGQTYSAPLVLVRGADRFAVLAAYWWQLAILAVVSTALLCQLVARACKPVASRRGHHPERLLAYTCITFLSFCLIVAALTDQNWLPRHAFALHVLLMLLLPTLLVKSRQRRLPLGEVTLAALIALNLLSLGNYYFEPAHWRDDYRGMSAYLSNQYQQGARRFCWSGRSHCSATTVTTTPSTDRSSSAPRWLQRSRVRPGALIKYLSL